MRVTGDCFRAPDRLDVDRFAPDREVLPRFVVLLRFAALLRFVTPRVALAELFEPLLLRAVVRFDADDFRRALPPDDFDAVAMMIASEEGCARGMRKIRAQR